MAYTAKLSQKGKLLIKGEIKDFYYLPETEEEIDLYKQFLKDAKPIQVNFSVQDPYTNKWQEVIFALSEQSEVVQYTQKEIEQMVQAGIDLEKEPTVKSVLEKMITTYRWRNNRGAFLNEFNSIFLSKSWPSWTQN